MKKTLGIAIAVAILLALIPAVAFAVTQITGSIPQSCSVWVPPYNVSGDTVFYVYYPEKDNLTAKCTAVIPDPPAEVMSYTWPGNQFCWSFPGIGDMCTSGGVSTIEPNGQGRTIWKFTRP